MSAHSRTGMPRRMIASVMLPLVVLAFTAPVSPHEQAADADCHHTALAGLAVSQGDSSSPGCDHEAGTACAAMLGCVVLPSALMSATAPLSAPGATTVMASFANGALHGRLGLGPPTPPPNS